VLTFGESAPVIGQSAAASGIIWWQIEGGTWVRSDVVTTSGDCGSVPVVSSDGGSAPSTSAPAAQATTAPTVVPPNATEEASS